jgi:hypothetical protein
MNYSIVYLRDGENVYQADLFAKPYVPEEVTLYHVVVPTPIAAQGYDSIRIFPTQGDGQPYLEHIRLLDADDAPTPHVVLDEAWEFRAVATPDVRWARSPATITIDSPRKQGALLWIEPVHLYDPDAATSQPLGDQGTLDISSAWGRIATVEVTVSQRIAFPVVLEAGRQQFTFQHHAGNFFAGTQQRSFALRALRVEPFEQPSMPPDLLVNGSPQQTGADEEQVVAIYGRNWYTREPQAGQAGVRWAQSPADIFIYSPTAQWAELDLLPGALYDPDSVDGTGYQGTLRITANGEQFREGVAVVGQPLTTAVKLDAGVNRITLNWAAGSFRPARVNPTSSDDRVLSFALEQIDVRLR